MNQETIEIESSPELMGDKIQEMVLKGWRIHPDRKVSQIGFKWECTFVRVATEQQLADDNKPSRAEILAKARAAKAANKQAKEQE